MGIDRSPLAQSPRSHWHRSDFRLRRLKLLVSLAWQHCPGYREWWSRHGWHPSELRSLTMPNSQSLQRNNPTILKHFRSRVECSDDVYFRVDRAAFSFRYTSALRAAHFSHAAAAFSYAAPDLLRTQIRLASLTTRPVRGLSATGSAGSLMLSHAALRQPKVLRTLLRAYQPTGFSGIASCARKKSRTRLGKVTTFVLLFFARKTCSPPPDRRRADGGRRDRNLRTVGRSQLRGSLPVVRQLWRTSQTQHDDIAAPIGRAVRHRRNRVLVSRHPLHQLRHR